MKKHYLLFDKVSGEPIFYIAASSQDSEFHFSTEDLWSFVEKHDNADQIKSQMRNPSVEGCIGFEIKEKDFEKKAINLCRYNPQLGGVEYRS